MAAAKPEVLVSQLLCKSVKKFQLLTRVFGVRKLNGAIGKTLSWNRKPEIQDGDCQTGCTYISASMLDSKEIPTAICMFLGSGNLVALLLCSILKPEVRNSRWWLPKPGVPISRPLYKIARKFQLLSACFWNRGTQQCYFRSDFKTVKHANNL
jgi:hypothetical protein